MANEFDQGIGISDWGIEEPTTRIIGPRSFSGAANSVSSPTLVNENAQIWNLEAYDFNYYYKRSGITFPRPRTATFETFIKKYLSLHKMEPAFWEKFKYNLIISNLLDNSLVLSKNEQILNSYLLSVSPGDNYVAKYRHVLNNDESELTILSKSYELKLPLKTSSPKCCIMILGQIIFLLKQIHFKNSSLSQRSKIKMFKLLLIMSTKFFHVRRAYLRIQTRKVLNLLDEFLVSNLKVNKKLLTFFLELKEAGIFNTLDKSEDSAFYSHEIVKNVSSTLNFLSMSLKVTIAKLLPFLNGPVFEKYCNVNELDLSIFTQLESSPNPMDTNRNEDCTTTESLTFRLRKFNHLRKFLVNQLLTITELPQRNYFVHQVWDIFGFRNEDILEHLDSAVTSLNKLSLLVELFTEQNEILKSSNILLEKCEKVMKIKRKQYDLTNTDIFSFSNVEPIKQVSVIDNNIEKLTDRLTNLAMNLKYFQKYHHSTLGIVHHDEVEEKMTIFSQFKDEINMVRELYGSSINDLRNELYGKQYSPDTPSSTSLSLNSSKRSTRVNNEFNLKSFHMLSSNSFKKFSSSSPNTMVSPTSGNEVTFNSPPQVSPRSVRSNPTYERKEKRSSSGLQLGLLTVLEEPKLGRSISESTTDKNSQLKQSKLGEITFEGYNNYPNMMAPLDYEPYNQMQQMNLDSSNNNAIIKRLYDRRNSSDLRFSLTSLASNVSAISDLGNLTQTSVLDEDANNDLAPSKSRLSRECLKQKLEENFNRMYNLYDGRDIKQEIMGEPSFESSASQQEAGSNETANFAKTSNEATNSFSKDLGETIVQRVTR